MDTLSETQKYHPYKIQLHQELNEDDPDRCGQFCEIMQNLCNRNPRFIKQIMFPDETFA